ncbi:MAG: LysR family transcriptional regulator [Desulfobacteraceae bacterium]|nr:MAG: LysR family transcriptional regulator [Desulfobacteraceae bacterium]
MEIRNFITLRTIVETGSFSKASKVLNYAQSSVTAHIRAIEEFYGTPVFDRIGKKVLLNDFGQIVFRHALKLLDAYDEVYHLTHDDSVPSGILRIGVAESTMLYRLDSILKNYKENYPDVEIIMENKPCPVLREDLRNGELDLALLLEQRRRDPDLNIHELIQEDMGIVLPKDYTGDTIDSLQGLAVLYTERGCSYRQIFQALLTESGISAENIIETTSVEVIKRYVTCGLGVSFLPLITIEKEIKSGQIRCIPWKSHSPILLQIALHKDKWVTPAMAEFIRMVKHVASGWSCPMT